MEINKHDGGAFTVLYPVVISITITFGRVVKINLLTAEHISSVKLSKIGI